MTSSPVSNALTQRLGELDLQEQVQEQERGNYFERQRERVRRQAQEIQTARDRERMATAQLQEDAGLVADVEANLAEIQGELQGRVAEESDLLETRDREKSVEAAQADLQDLKSEVEDAQRAFERMWAENRRHEQENRRREQEALTRLEQARSNFATGEHAAAEAGSAAEASAASLLDIRGKIAADRLRVQTLEEQLSPLRERESERRDALQAAKDEREELERDFATITASEDTAETPPLTSSKTSATSNVPAEGWILNAHFRHIIFHKGTYREYWCDIGDCTATSANLVTGTRFKGAAGLQSHIRQAHDLRASDGVTEISVLESCTNREVDEGDLALLRQVTDESLEAQVLGAGHENLKAALKPKAGKDKSSPSQDDIARFGNVSAR